MYIQGDAKIGDKSLGWAVPCSGQVKFSCVKLDKSLGLTKQFWLHWLLWVEKRFGIEKKTNCAENRFGSKKSLAPKKVWTPKKSENYFVAKI